MSGPWSTDFSSAFAVGIDYILTPTRGSFLAQFPYLSLVELHAEFRDLEGNLVDPGTVTLKYHAPLFPGDVETIVEASLTHSSTGKYSYIIEATATGMWSYRWEADDAATEGQFEVLPSILVE